MVFGINLRGCLATAAVLGCAVFAMARPDLNAFLNRKVSSTAQLVAQAKSDPEVMDRYVRHFSMTPDEVVALLSQLRLGPLPAEGTFKIYSVPGTGYLKAHMERLKKGHMMFFMADGTPALVALCGNPVIEGKDTTLVTMSPTSLDQTGPALPIDTPVAITETPLAIDLTPKEAFVPTVPEINRGKENLNPVPRIGASPIGLLGLGMFGLVSRRSSSPPVPEPATIAAVGIGCAAVFRRRKK